MDRPGAAACPPDDPDDVHRRRMFGLVPTTIILVLELLTYGLRIYCRKKTRQGIRWDDILMGIGILISLEPAICEFLLLANGLGHHICHLPADERNRFTVISFALQRANQPALACIKISILLMYLRLFSSERWLRLAAYANMAYTIAWAISTWIVNLTVCTPIAFYYDRTIPGGRCINQAVSGPVSGGLSLLGDVCILALPLPMVWRLQNINTRRKVAICGIFMLGCLTCVASAIRIAELIKFVPTDATYTQVYASTWTALELGVAAISGNLPLLAPLFERFFRRHTTSSYYRYRYDGPRSGRSGPRPGGGGTSTLSTKDGTIVNISRSSGRHGHAGGTTTTISVKSAGGGGLGMGGGPRREFHHHHHHHHRDVVGHNHSRLSDDDDDDDGLVLPDLDRDADVESQTTLQFGDGGSGGAAGCSEHNIELLDDRAILVRTHVDITTEPAPEHVRAGGGGGRAREEHARVVESWARAAAR